MVNSLQGRLAWGLHPWPVGDEMKPSASATGSMMRTLLEESRLWFVLEAAKGENVGSRHVTSLVFLGRIASHDRDLGDELVRRKW